MRNLKVLGVAVVSISAMSAIGAATSSANQFHSTAAKTTVTVASNTTQSFQYETGGETVECSTVGGSGTFTDQTITEVTFQPTYNKCVLKGVAFSKVVVDMNGCDYLFTIEAAKNSGPAHVVCQGTNQIDLTVEVFGVLFCIFHIGKQTPTGVSNYVNSGSMEVKVTAGQTGISGTMEPITMGGLACGSTTSNSGTYTGSVVAKCEEDGTQNQKACQVG
jgi:hypothetical protein